LIVIPVFDRIRKAKVSTRRERVTQESNMNIGPNHPSGGSSGAAGKGGGRRRRQHGKRASAPHSKNQQQNSRQGGGIYSAPMDHAYRNTQGQNGHGGRGRGRGARAGFTGTQYVQPDPEPLKPRDESAAPRIYAFIDDLFFLAKINEISRKLNIKVEFVKTEQDIMSKVAENGDHKPALIIVDLNNNSIKPLTLVSKLKSKLKKQTNIIGFLSHVQGDLKLKAQEAGCDMVLPRSAFSQNLPNLLRRHAADEDEES
jgi:CheY-like chemotaxis protein